MKNRTLFPFDDVNRLTEEFTTYERLPKEKRPIFDEEETEDLIEELLELFLLCYDLGLEDSAKTFSDEIAWEKLLDTEKIQQSVEKSIDGKTFEDRVRENIESKNMGSMVTLIDTESRRNFNTGAYDGVEKIVETVEKKFTESTENNQIKEIDIFKDDAPAETVESEKERMMQRVTGANVVKTWRTQLDDKVRETHDYLEGMTVVGMMNRFYTIDGDSARYPMDFADPNNNINCRCYIEYGD